MLDKIKKISNHIVLESEKLKQKNYITTKKEELIETIENIYEDPSISSDKKIELIINATSLICGIIAAQPIPFADVFILTPIQIVMIVYISKIYEIKTTNTKAKEIIVYLLGTLGFGVLSQQTILGLYKTIIPYAGAITTIPLVYIATYILGKCAKILIKAKADGTSVSKETLTQIRRQEYERLKKETINLSPNDLKLQFENLKRKDYKAFKDILIEFDNEIKIDTFDITSMINKRITLIERFSLYDNIQIKENVFNVLVFMNKNDIHSFENLISKLHRNEIIPKKENVIYNFNNVFKVKVKSYKSFYIIEEINHSDNNIMNMMHNNTDKEEKLLHNKEIRDQFLQAFTDAKETLCISSPWLGYSVINDEFKQLIETTLQRGVTIKIRYGIGNNNDDSRNNATNTIAQDLQNRFHNYENFIMIKANAHSKILICDNSYYLLGSYNYLSFSGKYDNSDLREEESIYSTNKQIIETLYKKFEY